jgi:cell division protein DivIC
MKNFKRRNVLKKLLIIAFLIYFIYTIISQQRTLNSYATIKDSYNDDIEMAQEENQELQEMKDNINSDEYIEQIAREKLDMYYPNERVYIDVEN